jgi:hypothetical protein
MPTRAELEAAHCWEADDRVPGRPEMTCFRRAARLHHARWREAHGHPIGTQPIVPRSGSRTRRVGNRLPLEYARATGATFVTPAAWRAAQIRTAAVEPNQSFDHQRLWADLLWSSALAFNLFGNLAVDRELADRAVHTWWPNVPGTVHDVRFAHSPGRLDPSYLNSLREFDTAVVLDLDDGDLGMVGIDVKYHERNKQHVPKPQNRWRNDEVVERSGVFSGEIRGVFDGSDLTGMFLEHLLLLSMLEHPSATWRWARYVVLYPAGNVDVADACTRYRDLLIDPSTFTVMTLEDMLAAGALPASTVDAVGERYLM